MDLVVLGLASSSNIATTNSSSTSSSLLTEDKAFIATTTTTSSSSSKSTKTLFVHRTVSWQKLATLSAALVSAGTEQTDNTVVEKKEEIRRNTTNNNNNNNNNNIINSNNNNISHFTHTTWRPDGRVMAVACTNGTIVLYHIEALLSATNASSSASGNVMSTTTDQNSNDVTILRLTSNDKENNNNNNKSDILFQPSTTTSTLPTTTTATVQALYWGRGSKVHSQWTQTQEEINHQYVYWDNDGRTHYLDKCVQLVPPSAYYQYCYGHGGDENTNNSSNNRSYVYNNNDESAALTCQTPLSVLCVVTQKPEHHHHFPTLSKMIATTLHMYLHGRYPILSYVVRTPSQEKSTITTTSALSTTNDIMSMTGSNDLTHWMMLQSTQLTIYSVPILAKSKYDWQVIATLYSDTQQHLVHIIQQLPFVAAAYKIALKPVDTKLMALETLLQLYSLPNLKACLLQYLLAGHAAPAKNLCNAMDQFFTGVQMNDQLMIRMERSLSVTLANVESQLQQHLVAPAQALAYQCDELMGVARARPHLLSPSHAHRTSTAVATLLSTLQCTHMHLVDARIRVRDFIAWCRSVAGHVRARGTAPTSVQRAQAHKRRVSAAVVQRMGQYLQQSSQLDSPTTKVLEHDEKPTTSSSARSAGVTERVLGLQVYALLQDSDEESCVTLSPLSRSHGNDLPQKSLNRDKRLQSSVSTVSARTTSWSTLPHCVRQVQNQLQLLFDGPPRLVRESVQRIDVTFPLSASSPPPVAMTVRVGAGGIEQDDDDHHTDDGDECDKDTNFHEDKNADTLRGYFAASLSLDRDCRQWCVLAQAGKDGTACTKDVVGPFVQLFALPLTWTMPEDNDEEDDDEFKTGLKSSHCGTLLLRFPSNFEIADCAFYGNDGKNVLSVGDDRGTGQEGPQQALGVLLCSSNASTSTDVTTPILELWLIEYDSLQFNSALSSVDVSSTKCRLPTLHAVGASVYDVRATSSASDNSEEGTSMTKTIYAKTRPLTSTTSNPAVCRLVMNGSRGVGAVLSAQVGGTVLDLFDLEEDEGDEEEDEDDEEDENVNGAEIMEESCDEANSCR